MDLKKYHAKAKEEAVNGGRTLTFVWRPSIKGEILRKFRFFHRWVERYDLDSVERTLGKLKNAPLLVRAVESKATTQYEKLREFTMIDMSETAGQVTGLVIDAYGMSGEGVILKGSLGDPFVQSVTRCKLKAVPRILKVIDNEDPLAFKCVMSEFIALDYKLAHPEDVSYIEMAPPGSVQMNASEVDLVVNDDDVLCLNFSYKWPFGLSDENAQRAFVRMSKNVVLTGGVGEPSNSLRVSSDDIVGHINSAELTVNGLKGNITLAGPRAKTLLNMFQTRVAFTIRPMAGFDEGSKDLGQINGWEVFPDVPTLPDMGDTMRPFGDIL